MNIKDLKDRKIKSNSYLTFEFENELYAVHVFNVLNIIELTKITKVPKSPEYMLGVVNLRGVALPIVDLHQKFGLKILQNIVYNCIIVMNIKINEEPIMVGILVDSVQEVIELDQNNLMPSPNIGNKSESKFIDGITHEGDKLILVINMEKLFSVEDIIRLSEQRS